MKFRSNLTVSTALLRISVLGTRSGGTARREYLTYSGPAICVGNVRRWDRGIRFLLSLLITSAVVSAGGMKKAVCQPADAVPGCASGCSGSNTESSAPVGHERNVRKPIVRKFGSTKSASLCHIKNWSCFPYCTGSGMTAVVEYQRTHCSCYLNRNC
jgi:hypothetical protein